MQPVVERIDCGRQILQTVQREAHHAPIVLMGPVFDVRSRESVCVLQRRRQRHAIGGLRQIVTDGEGAEAVTEMATEPGVVLPAPWRADTAEWAQHLSACVRTGGAIEVETVDEATRDVGLGELRADQSPDKAHVGLRFSSTHISQAASV